MYFGFAAAAVAALLAIPIAVTLLWMDDTALAAPISSALGAMTGFAALAWIGKDWLDGIITIGVVLLALLGWGGGKVFKRWTRPAPSADLP